MPNYPVYLGGQLNGISIIGSSNNYIGGGGGNTIQNNLQVGLYITEQDFTKKRYAPPVNTTTQNNVITTLARTGTSNIMPLLDIGGVAVVLGGMFLYGARRQRATS